MARFILRAILTLAIALLLDLAPLSAQFYPGYRGPYPVRVGPPQIYPFVGYPIPFRPPFYLPVQTTGFVNGNPFNMTFNFSPRGMISPVPPNGAFFFSGIYSLGNGSSIQLNPNFTPNPSTFWIQPQMPNQNVIGAITPNGLSNFGGGVVGMGVPEGANRPIVDVERNALIAAQNAGRFQTGPNPDTVKWANEHNSTKQVDPLVRVDGNLIYPNEEELFSGDILNELANRIAALEAKGRRASPGLIPPELLDRIHWVGGPPAEAMNYLRRPTKPIIPDAARTSGKYNAELEMVTFAHGQIVTTIHSNRSVTEKDMSGLMPAFKALREVIDQLRTKATVAEASTLTQYLNAYESAIKYTTTREAAGVTQSKWNSVGVNISELIQHVRKHKVNFGRAADGDEAAYSSMHRGLLDYFAALVRSGK